MAAPPRQSRDARQVPRRESPRSSRAHSRREPASAARACGGRGPWLCAGLLGFRRGVWTGLWGVEWDMTHTLRVIWLWKRTKSYKNLGPMDLHLEISEIAGGSLRATRRAGAARGGAQRTTRARKPVALHARPLCSAWCLPRSGGGRLLPARGRGLLANTTRGRYERRRNSGVGWAELASVTPAGLVRHDLNPYRPALDGFPKSGLAVGADASAAQRSRRAPRLSRPGRHARVACFARRLPGSGFVACARRLSRS